MADTTIRVSRAWGEGVRDAVALAHTSLRKVAAASGLNYDRVVRVVGGERPARPGEVEAIEAAVGQLSAREPKR